MLEHIIATVIRRYRPRKMRPINLWWYEPTGVYQDYNVSSSIGRFVIGKFGREICRMVREVFFTREGVDGGWTNPLVRPFHMLACNRLNAAFRVVGCRTASRLVTRNRL